MRFRSMLLPGSLSLLAVLVLGTAPLRAQTVAVAASPLEFLGFRAGATLDEIAENDYNLNIPRYVDTFEPEPEIDLAAVTAEIKQLDASTAEIDAKIAKYTQGLGIKSPF